MSKVHLKGLNGLRAIAAMGVLFAHLNVRLNAFGLERFPPTDLAGFGVTMFFSLSGFLITFLLLREKDKTSTINPTKFYVRRILRIWPLYFLYISLVILTLQIIERPYDGGNLWYYLLFVPNLALVIDSWLPMLDHYWSLGVEEQFYAFWPWLVKWTKKLLPVLLAFTFLFLVVKGILRWNVHKGGEAWPYDLIFETRFDCMAIGAIGAWFYHQKKPVFFMICFHPIAQIIAWAGIVLTIVNYFHIASIIDHEIIATLTVFLIVNVSDNEKTLINLDNRVFDFLGRISFGIYVYHPLVIAVFALTFGTVEMPTVPKMILVYTGVILLTISIAWFSYHFIERKFLKLKDRFAVVESAGSKYFN